MTIAVCVWLLLSKHQKAFYSVQIIALISLLLMGFTDARKIYRGYAELAERKGVGSVADNSPAPVYR
ncbi:hypothetical protein, partial [Treponema endosymbiont of Eucomonympha sp.]|uniref:hypothetical protein n=1 Tax=Treponema endosymbiont of Eucomonympha sp. TaxID=1580831 RepID=UPI0013967FFC